MDQIDYRKVREADYTKVEELIRKTWGSKSNHPAHIERALRKVNLYHYLSEQNYSCVAVRGSEVVGIILGRSDHLPYLPNKLKYLFPLLLNKMRLCLSRRGRRILRNARAEAKADKQLLRSARKQFDGELVLFVTDSSVQRHGIGTSLLRRFYQFMEQNNSKNLYLFTDTTCNFGFYQRKGYRRIAEKRVHYQTHKGPASEDHFLYTKDLELCSRHR